MASKRKRKAKHCFNSTSEVPRHSSIPGAETICNASTSLSDADQDHHFLLPLTDSRDILLSDDNPRSCKRRGKEILSPILYDDPLPHPELSAATMASMPCVPAPCATSSFVCGVPILHLHMHHTSMAKKILQYRQGSSMTVHNKCISAEEDGGCVYVGDIVMELDGLLDMAAVFREGKLSVQLSLVLYKGQGREGEDNGEQWLLKLEVGETVNYMQLKMDPRFSGIPCQLIEKMWQTTSSLMKLFLAQSAESCVLQESLRLEVWALNMMHHSGCAFDAGTKLTNQSLYTLFVKTLYQTAVLMDTTDEGLLVRVMEGGFFLCGIVSEEVQSVQRGDCLFNVYALSQSCKKLYTQLS